MHLLQALPDGGVLSTTEMSPGPTYSCTPDQIAGKSFFLGPQAENASWFRELLKEVLDSYFQWRRAVYPDDGSAISVADRLNPAFQESRERFRAELDGLLRRFEEEMPKFSPRDIGHMFSETSLPALAGHVVTLLHNPNNISGESSRVGVQVEDEAIQELAKMFGLKPQAAEGHFTSGGTVANFEALIRARRRMERFLFAAAQAKEAGFFEGDFFEAAHMGWNRLDLLTADLADRSLVDELEEANPFVVANKLHELFGQPYLRPVVLVPEHKHYSWVKGVDLLGIGREAFWSVALNKQGVMCVESLKGRIEEAREAQRPIMLVVSVAGTTELSSFDPVHKIQDLLDDYAQQGLHIWHHVDAAYGGFFAANLDADHQQSALEPPVHRALASIKRVNSITLDPHKLGYVPYSSGTFLARKSREYFAHEVDAPYLDFERRYDRGPQTLEGSRSAAGASPPGLQRAPSASTMTAMVESLGAQFKSAAALKRSS